MFLKSLLKKPKKGPLNFFMNKKNNLIIFRCGKKSEWAFFIIAIFFLICEPIVWTVVIVFAFEPSAYPFLYCNIILLFQLFFITTYRPIFFVLRKFGVNLDKKVFIAFPSFGLIGRNYQKKEIINIEGIDTILFYYSFFDSNNKRIPDCDSAFRDMRVDPAFLSADFILKNGESKKILFQHLEKNKIIEIKFLLKSINPSIKIISDFSKIC